MKVLSSLFKRIDFKNGSNYLKKSFVISFHVHVYHASSTLIFVFQKSKAKTSSSKADLVINCSSVDKQLNAQTN